MTGLDTSLDTIDLAKAGAELYALARELYPVCRSITGDGIRETLRTIRREIPLQIHEVRSGTKVFDWEVPKEWNIRDAYIKDASGRRIVDFHEHNLHVVNYSVPVQAEISLEELQPHLHSLPDHPDRIPYRTSYYQENWGFCVSDKIRQTLNESKYEVGIDSTLANGHLSYGEFYLEGRSRDEVLISVHACHPSLANDNLSGVVVATALAKILMEHERRYSYRFLFIPGTIGAITWLALNRETASRVRHGLVLTCVGDAGGFHYKKSRRGMAEIDRVMAQVLRHSGEPFQILDFSPYGYDERQYCSPGFDLPVGCLMRSVWGTFPEYHTSADNLDFIHPEKLAGSLQLSASAVRVLEADRRYINQNPFCEPQLGKRGLYRSTGGESISEQVNARLWVLNFSDGKNSLLDIAERSGLPFGSIQSAARVLQDSGLLAEAVATS